MTMGFLDIVSPPSRSLLLLVLKGVQPASDILVPSSSSSSSPLEYPGYSPLGVPYDFLEALIPFCACSRQGARRKTSKGKGNSIQRPHGAGKRQGPQRGRYSCKLPRLSTVVKKKGRIVSRSSDQHCARFIEQGCLLHVTRKYGNSEVL